MPASSAGRWSPDSQAAGAEVVVPRSAEVDLRDRTATAELFAHTRADLVIHLAARVGGIGYNQVHPAELYLDNLLMGTYVVEEARGARRPRRCWSGRSARIGR